MKQLTFIKTKTLQWKDVEEPKIEKDTDALIRPFLRARCDLDITFLHNNILKNTA